MVVEPDARKIDKLRQRYVEMGVYGQRLHVIQGTPESAQLPNYFASLTILWNVDASELLTNKVSFANLCASIRPYGGVLWAPAAKNHFDQIQNIVHRRPN